MNAGSITKWLAVAALSALCLLTINSGVSAQDSPAQDPPAPAKEAKETPAVDDAAAGEVDDILGGTHAYE